MSLAKESGLLRTEPTAPAEQAHHTAAVRKCCLYGYLFIYLDRRDIVFVVVQNVLRCVWPTAHASTIKRVVKLVLEAEFVNGANPLESVRLLHALAPFASRKAGK